MKEIVPRDLWWVWGWGPFAICGDIGRRCVHRSNWRFFSNCGRHAHRPVVSVYRLIPESTIFFWAQIGPSQHGGSLSSAFSLAYGLLNSCFQTLLTHRPTTRCPSSWNNWLQCDEYLRSKFLAILWCGSVVSSLWDAPGAVGYSNYWFRCWGPFAEVVHGSAALSGRWARLKMIL